RQAAVAVRCHARELLVVPQAPSRDGGTDAGGAHVVELRAWCRTLALRLRLQDGVRYAVTAEVANSPSRWAELAGRTRPRDLRAAECACGSRPVGGTGCVRGSRGPARSSRCAASRAREVRAPDV